MKKALILSLLVSAISSCSPDKNEMQPKLAKETRTPVNSNITTPPQDLIPQIQQSMQQPVQQPVQPMMQIPVMPNMADQGFMDMNAQQQQPAPEVFVNQNAGMGTLPVAQPVDGTGTPKFQPVAIPAPSPEMIAAMQAGVPPQQMMMQQPMAMPQPMMPMQNTAMMQPMMMQGNQMPVQNAGMMQQQPMMMQNHMDMHMPAQSAQPTQPEAANQVQNINTKKLPVSLQQGYNNPLNSAPETPSAQSFAPIMPMPMMQKQIPYAPNAVPQTTIVPVNSPTTQPVQNMQIMAR